MRAPDEFLDKLRARGLVVSEHEYADGVRIGKPDTVRGNNVPEMGKARWGMSDVILDAPCVSLGMRSGKWVVRVSESEPGPGPGDFTREFDSVDEAVADVVDYFFGDASRMNEFNEYYRRKLIGDR